TVGKQLIDLAHPLFPQGTHFLLDQALGEGQLRTRGLDQISSSLPCGSAGNVAAPSAVPASSTAVRGSARKSPPRSVETRPTRSAHHAPLRPAPQAHTPSEPCPQPCSGNTGAARGDWPDHARTRTKSRHTGGSTQTAIPAPSRRRSLRVRAGAYPYYSL